MLRLYWGKPQTPKAKTQSQKKNHPNLEIEFCFIGLLVMTEKIYRTKEIKVRLTDEEHGQLLAKMTGTQLAVWIRETCLEQKPKKPPKTADPELLRQLGKIGANLNQIAKIANTEQATGGVIDRLRLTRELATLREQLNEILKRHDS